MNRPEWLIDEPYADYAAHGNTHLRSHDLQTFRRSPALYMHEQENPRPDSPAFALGRAAHTLILEGQDALAERYRIGGPVNPKTGQEYGATTKAWAEWCATLPTGVEALSRSDYAASSCMANAVAMHELAHELTTGGTAEGVVRGEVRGVQVQARIDYMIDQQTSGSTWPRLIDLKTTRCIDDWERDARKYGYYTQMAFYRLALGAAGRYVAAYDMHWVVVESAAPWRVGVWQLDAEDLQAEEDRIIVNLETFSACREHGFWPTGYEHCRVLSASWR